MKLMGCASAAAVGGGGCGGGSLGGQRGDDCRIDLGLKDCGGFCISHPKRNKKRWPGVGEGGGNS